MQENYQKIKTRKQFNKIPGFENDLIFQARPKPIYNWCVSYAACRWKWETPPSKCDAFKVKLASPAHFVWNIFKRINLFKLAPDPTLKTHNIDIFQYFDQIRRCIQTPQSLGQDRLDPPSPGKFKMLCWWFCLP